MGPDDREAELDEDPVVLPEGGLEADLAVLVELVERRAGACERLALRGDAAERPRSLDRDLPVDQAVFGGSEPLGGLERVLAVLAAGQAAESGLEHLAVGDRV